jgi:predicted CXXCH cytochrome family protein
MTIVSKKTVGLILVSAGMLVTSLAMAAGNVANTKHNFAIGGGSAMYQSTQISEVCIFCHTPHNAGRTRQLWNKVNNGASPTFATFRLYTSSGTLTTVTRNSKLTASSPSLLCLSCHDGKTAMNVLHSSSTGVSASGDGYPAGSKYISQSVSGFAAFPMASGPTYDFFTFSFTGPTVALGTTGGNTAGDNLTDDHPIGFSYSAVLSERAAAPGGLRTLANVNGPTYGNGSIRFFGGNNVVECSTCHDPHVDYSPAGNPLLKPFLVMDNTGSKLCLSCHDK